jgi:hypothetical protein
MGRAFVVACVLAGCYAPREFPGAPCETDSECPSGQSCVAKFCELPGDTTNDAGGGSHDAAFGGHDAPTDGQGMPGPNGWYPATRVPGVNTPATETDPSYTEDALTIVFTSERSGGTGGLDLYIGTRNALDEPFTVRELTELNSTADDQSAVISQDGTQIFFSTTRAGTDAEIFSSTRATATATFSAPAEVTSLSKDHNGNLQSSIRIAISPDLTEAIVIEAKGTKLQWEGYDRPDTSSAWTDEEELFGMQFTTDVTGPTLTDNAALVYFQSGTPAQIMLTMYTESTDTFSTPFAITDLSGGTRDAAPSISAGGSHIVFERDGDLYESHK